MTKIIRSFADFLYPFLLIFGFYIVIHGHLTPGGGFQGGAVIATGIALMFVANHHKDIQKHFKKVVFNTCELIGLSLFGLLSLSGILYGKSFLYNWMANGGGLFGQVVAYGPNAGTLNAGGLVPLLNMAVGLEVLGALSMIIYYMMTYASQNGETK